MGIFDGIIKRMFTFPVNTKVKPQYNPYGDIQINKYRDVSLWKNDYARLARVSVGEIIYIKVKNYYDPIPIIVVDIPMRSNDYRFSGIVQDINTGRSDFISVFISAAYPDFDSYSKSRSTGNKPDAEFDFTIERNAISLEDSYENEDEWKSCMNKLISIQKGDVIYSTLENFSEPQAGVVVGLPCAENRHSFECVFMHDYVNTVHLIQYAQVFAFEKLIAKESC